MTKFIVMIAFLWSTAQAGVLAVYKGSGGEASKRVAYIDKRGMRVDETGGKQGKQSVIIKSGKNIIYILNHSEKSYQSIDLDKVASKMNEAQKMMEEKMKGMSKAQREQMKQFMPSSMFGSKKSLFEWKLVNKNQKVNQWKADHYKVSIADSYEGDYWYADWKQFDIDRSDLRPIKEFAQNMTKLVATMRQASGEAPGGFNKDRGVVVKEKTADGSIELQKFKKASKSAKVFNIPSSYKKKNIQGM